MRVGYRSVLHVILQFSSLIYLLKTTFFGENRELLFVLAPGILLGLWAVWVMNKSRISVFPDPPKGSALIKNGPYKYIRHPMYTALFLLVIPCLIIGYSNFRLLVFLIFTVNQVLKLVYEEKLLIQKMDGYEAYMNNTFRIFPHIW